MTLLEDIQTAAVDTSSDLGTLLRKCKILAARLQSQPLEDWLIWESNGYPENKEVPDYRIWPLEVKGNFGGPYGSDMRNAPIPLACLPEGARKSYDRYECRLSIASIEASVENLKKTDSDTVHVSTGDLSLVLGMKVYRYRQCLEAWAEFGVGNLIELLNAVRNRILDFALAVWKEEPTAGEVDATSSATLESKRVTQIFHTTVYGGTANLVGNASDSTVTFSVVTNDFPSLERFLRGSGLEDEDIQDLRIALESDAKQDSEEKFGPTVSAWLGKMIQKAASGSWDIGVSAASNLLIQAIAKFCGL